MFTKEVAEAFAELLTYCGVDTYVEISLLDTKKFVIKTPATTITSIPSLKNLIYSLKGKKV
jgi:hypothetical protein